MSHRREHAAGRDKDDIHQAGATGCEHELTIDTFSKLVVYTSNLVRFTRRERTEGLELGTVRDR